MTAGAYSANRTPDTSGSTSAYASTCLASLNTSRGLTDTYQGYDCAMPAGHAEWHRDATGFSWREVRMEGGDDD